MGIGSDSIGRANIVHMNAIFPSEIDILLNTFHSAAGVGDFDTYISCFDPQGRFLGTDGEENWSISEFKEYCRPHFSGGSAWIYIPVPGTRKCNCFPPPPNSPRMVTFDELLQSPSLNCRLRGSGTVVFNDQLSQWLILSYHLSIPIPDEAVSAVVTIVGPHLLMRDRSFLQRREEEAARAAASLLEELDLEESLAKSSTRSSKQKKKKKK